MRLVLAILALALLTVDTKAQFSGHKSEAEIARMNPGQRVEEYCREYLRHGVSDDDYRHLLDRYIDHDGLKAVPSLVKIIDDYDPTRLEHGGKDRSERFDAAWMLLSGMDETVVRLRASDEGRVGINAMRQAVGRMKAAHFDSTEAWQYNRQGRYQLSLAALKAMDGMNRCDESIRATLMLKYKISLSDQEMLDFANYLISKYPNYPAWSEKVEYKDLILRNEAGNPIWYLILKKPEPFYDAYLQFKAKRVGS